VATKASVSDQAGTVPTDSRLLSRTRWGGVVVVMVKRSTLCLVLVAVENNGAG